MKSMEVKTKASGKYILLFVLVAMLMATTVSVAYSYSSSITGSDAIGTQYMYVNVCDESDAGRSKFVFTLDSAEPVSPGGVLSGDAEFNLNSTPSKIKIEGSANSVPEVAGKHQVHLWGYFTGSSDRGVAVESLTFYLDNGGETITYTVYRDAYVGSQVITLAEGETLTANLTITKVVAHYYDGLVFVGGNLSVSHNGGAGSSVTKDDAISINGFVYHFMVSGADLLSE